MTRVEAAAAQAADDNARQPLAHVRVLELGQVIAGTVAGMMLADLGADVIKVEPRGGDLGRNPRVAPLGGESALFVTFNRGKRSVALDLKKDGGLRAFHDLVRAADVVIDNFRPGVLERLGIDYETLARMNPGIVCCSVTGFASTSARREMPSFDLTHQALSGLMSITGEADGPPVRLGIPIADLGAPLLGVQGILAALLARERTGRGRRVELNMLECATFLLTYDATLYLNTGEGPRRWGSAHAYHVPWQAFETKDGHVVVATREEVFWRAFCEAAELTELAEDPRYATNLERVRRRDELVPRLEARMRQRTTAEWLRIFAARQVPSAPVNTVAQALTEPGLPAEGVVMEVPYAPLGSVRMLRSPIHLSGAEPAGKGPPTLGEHTREVLAELAGYSAARIEELAREGAVFPGGHC
jgi:crotonobetainyl-CoA:carnitine CoA-transferase CaiB-like acyl-CoA transferase